MSILPILMTAFCTSVGALPILFIKDISHKGKDVLLAFTAGIMVAASSYGLIPSALKLSNMMTLIVGILIGTIVLTFLESVVPHHDLDHSENNVKQSSVILFLIAMSIHNLPEGLSVGISNANTQIEFGNLVSFAIGLQNVPEGFLVALFLITQQVSRMKALFFATLTGLIEFIAGLIGILFGESFEQIIPYGLAFAAGSMLYVVYKELIPESHGDGHERAATFTFILGFITMVFLTDWFR